MRSQKLLTYLGFLLLIAVFLILAPKAGLAQTESSECPALVKQALDDLGQNCGALDRNSACYGYNRVNATFAQSVADNFFSTPADRAGLSTLASIETAPLDVTNNNWGIAVLNVQANVPNTLPGQAVTFVLLGDVKVENAVEADNTFEPVTPITITAVVGANIRSAGGVNANVIGSLKQGEQLPADGLSADGKWLRVVYQGGVGWVSREVVQGEPGTISSLPTITRDSRTPMQAFYFRTGVGSANCTEAPPSLLVVQGPDNVKVDITANGADIRIGSTIALRFLEGNQVQLIVVSGEAEVGDLKIPAGFTLTAPLTSDGKGLAGDWTDFRPLTQAELNELKALENLPINLLHYRIVLPTLEEIQRILAVFSQSNPSSQLPGVDPSTAGQVDCNPFRGTSPLDGLPFGPTTFYWDAAPGATSYRVNLFDGDNVLKTSLNTAGPQTSIVGDTSGLGGGFTFSWNVQALINGQVACSTNQVTMYREAPPAGPAEAPPLLPTPTCVRRVCS